MKKSFQKIVGKECSDTTGRDCVFLGPFKSDPYGYKKCRLFDARRAFTNLSKIIGENRAGFARCPKCLRRGKIDVQVVSRKDAP